MMLQYPPPESPPNRVHHASRCAVCEAPLAAGIGARAASTGDVAVCHAVACRMVASRRQEMGEAGFRHYLQTQARHRQHLVSLKQEAAERKLAEVRENAKVWSALRARVPAPVPAAAQTSMLELLLPTGPRRARPLSALRRARYREHLADIVGEALTLPPSHPNIVNEGVVTVPANANANSTLPGQLCGLCGGGCCTRGAEKAYLGAQTMRRYLDAHPGVSADEVVDAYMAHVTPVTQAGSCINHTRQGCSLPREMRSDICNRFACEPLARLLSAQRGGEPMPVVLVVRRNQDHWRRAQPDVDNDINAGAVLRETGVERFRPQLLTKSPDAQAATPQVSP